MTTRRAAIYCRISQDREGAGLGIERQRLDCEALAKRLGWDIVAQHTDNDVSAYSGKTRPGYLALLDSIRRGEVDAVLAWHEDRLHRSPRELEDYIDACEPRAVVTHFAQAGELDLATASGRMTARIRGAVSRQESEHKSERTKRAQLQAAQAGKWLGGAPPYGWNLGDNGSATLDRREAREIRDACKSLLAGASLGSIVADLNARGVTTSTGRPWNYTSLRQVLTRPRNAGLSSLNGEVVGKSAWPAIVTEDTWRAVCAVLADPNRRRSTSNRVRWLLAGIAVCGKEGCGEPLRSATAASNRAKGTTRTVYRCRIGGGGHVARSASEVDRHVEGVMLGLLSRPDFLSALATDSDGPDAEALRLEAVTIRASMGEAADLFAAHSITGAQLAKITKALQERLDDAEAAMARASRGGALAPFVGRDPVKVWKGLTMDRKRAVVREVMTVTVLPSGKRGNGYDPTLTRIEPRGQE
jgi:DNA invertase Pin-like site-specific DNA recombinase